MATDKGTRLIRDSGAEVGIIATIALGADGQPIGGGGASSAGTDRSGTITTGGTAQTLAAANTSRNSLKGQNISPGDLWINEIGGPATANTAGSYKVPTGATFSIGTNRAISIVGATTGQAFTATET